MFSELPSNLVMKKVSPKIWLPVLTVVWGILTMCLGFVHKFGSFVAVRALLGFAEGGLLPGMVQPPSPIPKTQVYANSLFYSGPVPFALLPAARASSENRHFLHSRIFIWGFRRVASPWAQRDRSSWRSQRLALDLHRGRPLDRIRWPVLIPLPSQLD